MFICRSGYSDVSPSGIIYRSALGLNTSITSACANLSLSNHPCLVDLCLIPVLPYTAAHIYIYGNNVTIRKDSTLWTIRTATEPGMTLLYIICRVYNHPQSSTVLVPITNLNVPLWYTVDVGNSLKGWIGTGSATCHQRYLNCLCLNVWLIFK